MYPNVRIMLSQLENLIKQEILTPAKRVDLETYLCITETTPQGRMYHQCEFDKLPEAHRAVFLGRTVGESFGNYKLIGVFDIWPEAMTVKAPFNRGY
jgi:hypothetical protein